MKRIILIAIFNVSFFAFTFGQGVIRGKITDKNGETIIGAPVILKTNRAVGTTTDLDGNYSLKIPDSTAQVLVISYIGYKVIEENIHPVKGEVLIKNYVLESSTQNIKEVEITAKAVKAKEYYLENIKKKSATTIDYISSETMKKTGDNNVTAAVARVSGVSTNGGFITVRGIGDRYVKTSINGSRIPTLDPFTNNIKLDIFPASLVDNILISKTASPDLPGDWSGAYLSVETKDYPENLSVNVESTIGYNSQSTFKDVISSQRSSTDWLGYDNNLRDHNHNDFSAANINPGQYQEFVALGLGPYFNSLGVTQQNWGDGTTTAETYFKLGLVQLGLLAPALINDANAFTNAKNQYMNGPYRNDAYNVINANVPHTGKSFANNWNTIIRKAPLNFSQSFSIGNQTTLFGKPLGFLTGFRYGTAITYDPMSEVNRAAVAKDDTGNYINTVSSKIDQQVSRETNGWSALFNLAYKLNPNNNISILFMPNFNGTNNVRSSLDSRDSSSLLITKSQFYEQRKQLVYQFKSEHFVPGIKLKMEFNASYTNGESSAPDFKNLQYLKTPDQYQIGGTIGDGIHRYYRYLSDDIFDSRASFEIPLNNKTDLLRKVKVGAAYQRNNKKSDQYDYEVNVNPTPDFTFENGDIDQFLGLNNFENHTYTDINGQQVNIINLYYTSDQSAANFTFGNSSIKAGFAMLDYSVTSRIRFAGGLRAEQANVFTDVYRFDSLGLVKNDPRRIYDNSLPLANPGKLDELSFLPSVNIIYKLKQNEEAPVNLRLNFSQTVARPSIRELSDVAAFDYEFRTFIFGNSDLKMARINNYDVRAESYFKSGDNISASLFYKSFRNHIELVNASGYTWQNVDKSRVAGIELEGKKMLSKHIDLRVNVTLANSNTKYVRTRLEVSDGIKNLIPLDSISRNMYGQAPYVINGILTYSLDSIGFSVALSYNLQGPRLVIASEIKEIPDVYELQRHLLDVKASKSLSKHFSASVTVKNILNAPIRRSYNYNEGWILDYDNYKYGTTFDVAISYKL